MEVPSPVGNSNDYSRAGFDLHVSLSKYQKSKAIVNLCFNPSHIVSYVYGDL